MLDEYSMFNISIDNFRQKLNSLSDTTVGSLRVGILDHTITEKGFSTVKLISKFIEKAPNVELHIIQDIQSKLLRAIIDGRIDVAIGAFDTKIELIKAEFLYSERQHLYYSNKHPFFQIPPNQFTLEEIKSADRISRGYQLDSFDKLPIKNLNSSATAANIESVLVLILAGKHIGYMPAHFAKKYEERGQLCRILPRKLSVKVDISIIFRSNIHETLAMKKFVDICKSLA